MHYKNTYTIDQKSVRQELLEYLIIGSRSAKIFNLFEIFFVMASLISTKDNISSVVYLIIAVLIYMIFIIHAYRTASYYSRHFEDKTCTRVVVIEDDTISEKIYDGEKTVKEVSSSFNEISSVDRGFKYIFVKTYSKDMFILRKDSFVEGSIDSFNKEIALIKNDSDKQAAKDTDKFRIQKICLLAGTIISMILSIAYVISFNVDNCLFIAIKMIFVGILFSLWISFAITFYTEWYADQTKAVKILSIVLFPITYFVFVCIGLIKAVPYIVDSIRK